MLFKDKMPLVFMLIIAIQIQDCSVPPFLSLCVYPSLPCEHLGRENGVEHSPSSLALLHLTTSGQCTGPPPPPGLLITARAWFLVWFCPSGLDRNNSSDDMTTEL